MSILTLPLDLAQTQRRCISYVLMHCSESLPPPFSQEGEQQMKSKYLKAEAEVEKLAGELDDQNERRVEDFQRFKIADR